MTKIFSAFMFICSIAVTNGQTNDIIGYVSDPEAAIRNHNADFISLNLDLKFNPADGEVEGTANYLFQAIQLSIDSIFLDGPGILVQSIQLDNKATKFKIDSAGITVFFNPPLTRNIEHALSIQYNATPKKGIYFVGWNVANSDDPSDQTVIRKQIWTQGQGTDNRFWIPSYDGTNDKLITALNITFDSAYTVISNGALNNIKVNADGSKTWHYAMPHPHALYLVMIAIGKYEHLDYTSKNGITSRQYYYPGSKNTAENTYAKTAELMDFLVAETGFNYPWTTYSNIPVQEFLYGAMENTTATIYSDYYYQDERSMPDKTYVDINAHELTHQWFGDYVTAWSNSSHWLQESFATYYAKKFRQSVSGDDVYNWQRREEMNRAFNADNKNITPVAHTAAGSARVYQKGSFVLDMLHYVVGDEAFKIAIHDYLVRYPYQNVSSKDFEMQFMRSLGIDVNWFFDEWIYRGGYPIYGVVCVVGEKKITVEVNQQQQQSETVKLFKMPVHIQVHYLDGSFDDQLIWIEESTTSIEFNNPENKKLAFVLFDPNSNIYCKVNFTKVYEELRYQAFNAPNMMDRFDAIVQMRDTDIETKRNDLIAVYNKEVFHGIKSEIIAQLSNDDNKKSITLLQSALADTDPLVRRAVISNLNNIPRQLKDDLTLLLKDENYINIEIAFYQLCKLDADNTDKYLALTRDLKGSNNNIRIAWLEQAARDHNNEYIDELVNFAGPGYEFRTRVGAINALLSLNYCSENTVANLYNALISTNYRLSSTARNALTKFKQDPNYGRMIRDYYINNSWSDWEQQRISTVKD